MNTEATHSFLCEHRSVTRRFFVGLAAGTACAVRFSAWAEPLPARCAEACRAFLEKMDYLTPVGAFGNVSRGQPKPYDLPDETKQRVGLTRESWNLEVVSDTDPGHEASINNPMTKSRGNAFDFERLMKMAETRAVRFLKIMTCNNIGAPLGMGLWEGVALRDIIWLAKPREDLRRVWYFGYHNDDPRQMFRSSLPIGRVLEDPFGLPPVVVCYKLNGKWLDGQRGSPARIIVPEMYGYKSVKWLTRIVLSNIAHANDTYAEQNNDVASMMKTFAHSLYMPKPLAAGETIPITGYAQVGISGLSHVQYWIAEKDQPWPDDDPYFARAPWQDAHILPAPERWGVDLADGKLPPYVHGIDPQSGVPKSWPMCLTWAHWAALHPGLPAGRYLLRTRSIDANGIAQPMPRPFKKSGRNQIEETKFVVKAA